jgi:DNA-binding NtrC family response regulator
LPAPPQRVVDTYFVDGNGGDEKSLKQYLLNSEKDYLRGLLIKYKGGIGPTAKEAKVDNKTLYRKMRRHGLHKESFKDFE